MTKRVEVGGLRVAQCLHDLVEQTIAPGTGIDPVDFWQAFASIVSDLGPKNRELLDERDALQARIDAWYRDRDGAADPAEQEAFLREIGYLLPEVDGWTVATDNVDPEIASIAGPQLVVPVDNARYALIEGLREEADTNGQGIRAFVMQ